MTTTEFETADTERPEPEPEQTPLADAPCDAGGCAQPWNERVEFHDRKGHLHVRFVCGRHAYLYLMDPKH